MLPLLNQKLARGQRRIAFVPPPTVRQVRVLIWVYFWLLIFEGSLRKWVVPMLSDPLLLIRDPVVMLIYLQAIRGGFFPQHWLVRTTIWLGVVTFFWGCVHVFDGNYLTFVVTAFGVRTYFLHLPLIFIMGHIFKREDVLKVGRWCLLLAVPMAFLMVAQYKVDTGHWLNKATTGDDGSQLQAALGHVRPAGTFSFITGPATFYPLVTAFLIYGIMKVRTYSSLVLAGAAGATFLMLPVSGSRTLVISCSLIVIMAAVVLVRMPSLVPRFAIWAALVVFGGLTLLTLPVGQQAVESFVSRWDEASNAEGGEGGAQAAISKRVGGNFLEIFDYLPDVPIAGYGIGAGTNVGAKLMTGGVGFTMGENEWTRNVMEAGPILGFTYIGFRLVFTGFLLMLAWQKLGRGDPLPWLIMGCCAVNLIVGQTTQSTTLGFMVFIAGLSLGSVGVMQKREPISQNRRRWLEQKKRVRLENPMLG